MLDPQELQIQASNCRPARWVLVTRPRATAGGELTGAEPALTTEHLSILSLSSSNTKLAYKERTESKKKSRIPLPAPKKGKKVFILVLK